MSAQPVMWRDSFEPQAVTVLSKTFTYLRPSPTFAQCHRCCCCMVVCALLNYGRRSISNTIVLYCKPEHVKVLGYLNINRLLRNIHFNCLDVVKGFLAAEFWIIKQLYFRCVITTVTAETNQKEEFKWSGSKQRKYRGDSSSCRY